MQGVFSDTYAVKGIEIGQELVSVHLLEPGLKHMADSIALTVAEAMSLDPPSPLFVLTGAVVCYRLKIIRENIPQGFFLNPSLYSEVEHFSLISMLSIFMAQLPDGPYDMKICFLLIILAFDSIDCFCL